MFRKILGNILYLYFAKNGRKILFYVLELSAHEGKLYITMYREERRSPNLTRIDDNDPNLTRS